VTFLNFAVAPVPDLLSMATPQRLSSPSPPLYMDMGMVMMPKNGGPEGCATSRGARATKPVAVAVPLSL
jgi:hypothetical protein